jgi:hypothetical protein
MAFFRAAFLPDFDVLPQLALCLIVMNIENCIRPGNNDERDTGIYWQNSAFVENMVQGGAAIFADSHR